MFEAMNLLLVEDNPGDARLIKEMLIDGSMEQGTLDFVRSLQEAIDHVKSLKIDCILLDLSLPDSYGIDTVMKMRAEAPEIPIVVLTGNEDAEQGVEAVQRGAQDYLPKSDIDGRLLVRSIRYALERHRGEMALRRSEAEYRSLIDDVFDTSMVAVLILDREYRVVWCNEATEVYFNIEREHILGRDKRLLVDEELKCIFADPDSFSAHLLKAYENGEFTERFECQIIPEGTREERWLEHWSQPIREGIFSGGRIEQYNDITQRKRLEIAERELRDYAEALNEINYVLTGSLDLDDVFEQILTNLGRVVPHDSASITLMEDDHFRIAKQIYGDSRDTQELIAETRLKIDFKPYADIMYKTAQPVVIPDLQLDEEFALPAMTANIHAYIGSPILLREEVIGFINLLSEKVNFFTDTDAERLSSFARLASLAIQNAKLYEQSRQLAAHQERDRLARELHDSVSQTLFTCRAMSETALRRWHKDPESAYELIENVNQLSMTALSEMRILLLELRPSSLTRTSLRQLFEQYLQPIQERREFDLTLSIDNLPKVKPEVQIALYRITQEALNNIDKHAQATEVAVHVEDMPQAIRVSISDNGVGFDHDEHTSTSLGLGIMRERANEIGAQITIESQPDTGTQITVILPKDITL